MLVGSTVAVAVVLVATAAFLTGIPAGHAQGHASSAPQVEWLPTPNPDLAPTPLGLPPRPTPTEVATVPVQPVDSLKTGDCLQTFPSRWADGYPVVNCAAQHIAQVLSRGDLPEPAGAPFPGTNALDARVSDLCTALGLLNWDWVAVWNEDVQVDIRYPNTAAQWASGARSYYCFVYTFSRHELTGSAVAVH
ncbi:hypothetical protein G3T36_11195 [Diaminobutyricibacter tongyongensis]|uniref:Septum formation-related domain-containing protein n=1 Tax=Leifsonia tongyongensis TaxID=1268043 RepID=A0A6L9XZ00_9MICO|nr:septum formation family protein [Diaminobutyricibacter tongyongensis]NEN06437.1 hypothetical protein [Diaminobutyricibacter tongyongensis]